MARGVRTARKALTQFRKSYLVTGNVAASAKEVGLPISTGYDLARTANDDPAFVEARSAIYARALKDAETMVLAGMQIALDRLDNGSIDSEKMAKLAKLGVKSVTTSDSGPGYLRGLVDGYKAVTSNRRFAAELAGEIAPGGDVTIVVRPTAEAQARIEASQADAVKQPHPG